MNTQNQPRDIHRKFDLHTALNDMRVAATVTTAKNGGPVRLIINGGHRKPTGRYASRKARRSLPWESLAELDLFYVCEADTRVESYLSQPHKLSIQLTDGEPLVFYPDIRRDMANGAVEIIEVKKALDSRSRLDDPRYLTKLELAAQVYAGLGWSFKIITQTDMKRSDELATAKKIQRNRFARVTATDTLRIIDALAKAGGQLPFGAAAASLGGGPRATAKLKALSVLRTVKIDLSSRLSADTPVWQVAKHRGLRRADLSA